MELIKSNWTENDGVLFSKYLKSLSNGEDKSKWEQNILKTSLPCIAVPSEKVRYIIKQILKGNYIEFLNLNLKNNYTEIAIRGGIISSIKDFNIMKKYLDVYALEADCWATTDTLKFTLTNQNEKLFLNLLKSYATSPNTFVRRTAIIIAFKYINRVNFDGEILNVLKQLKHEKEYYVNMAVAWLVCEYFIKRKDFGMQILKSGILNDFTQNKAISKCRDSFRVSKSDKEYLLSLKRFK